MINIYRDETYKDEIVIDLNNQAKKSLTVNETLELIKDLLEEINSIESSDFANLTFQQYEVLLSITVYSESLLNRIDTEE